MPTRPLHLNLPSGSRRLANFALLTILYFVVARGSLFFVVQPEGLAAVWPPSGLALAALLLMPRSEWLINLAAIFFGCTAANLVGGNTLVISLAFAFANTIEPALGAWLFTRFEKKKISFSYIREILILGFVAIFANALTALIGAAIPTIAFGANYWNVFFIWWTSNGLGILVVAPLIITCLTGGNLFETVPFPKIVEGISAYLVINGMAWWVFATPLHNNIILSAYIIFSSLLWAAFRFTPRGTTILLVTISAIVVWGTNNFEGPFVLIGQSLRENIIGAQMFLFILVFISLLLTTLLTERKHFTEMLSQNETRYRTVANFTYDWEYWIDQTNTKILYISPSCENICGYSASEFENDPSLLTQIIHPDDQVKFQSHIDDTNSASIDFRIMHRDGTLRWIHHACQPVYTPKGVSLGRRVSNRDITERKRAEETLRASETMLKASQRVAHVGHYIFDIKRGSWSSSEILDGIFGITESYPHTMESWLGIIEKNSRDQMAAYFNDHVLRDHQPFDREYPIRRLNDGSLRWVHYVGELEFDDSGQPLKLFGTVQDITPYKDSKGQLSRRAEQLTILNDISNRVTLATSVKEVLQQVAELMHSHFHYHHIGLFLYEPERHELVMYAKAGKFISLFPENHILKLEQGMIGWVCRNRRTLLANDVRIEPAYLNASGNLLGTRSELSVPIQSGETFFGVIDLQSSDLNAFEDNDVLLIETLAQQIVAALKNARLHEQAFKELAERTRREHEMESVIRMDATLRNIGSRNELSKAVVQLLCESLDVKEVLFKVTDLLTDEHIVIGASGNWFPLQGEKFATSFVHQISPDGKPHLLEYEDRSKFAHPELLENLADVMVIPLTINNKQMGSLWIGSAHPISEETKRLFTLLSGLIVNVMQRVNSVEQTELHLRRLTALQEIDLAINYSLNLDQTLDILLHQVCSQLQVDAADVLLYNRQFQILSFAAGAGFRTTALQHSLLDLGKGLAGRAALEKKIVTSINFNQTDDFSRSPLLGREDFLSYYGVPLVTRGEIVGVLEIFHRSLLQPSPSWLQFLEALAAQAAIAIDNASLVTQLQNSIKSLRETQEQLIQTARLSAVGELAAGIAHQINNPLTTVISDSQVLMRLIPNEDPLHVSAKAIYQAGWRAQRVVQRLLNFARPDEGQYTQFNINDTITEALDLIGTHLGRGGVDLQIHLASDLPLLSANARQLEEIWLNLLMNARDALSDERKGRIEIRSSLSPNGDAIQVSIGDNGRGIRKAERAQLFTPFFTTKGKNRGNGLGLSVCQSIVQHHKGEITFTSEENVGTTFVVQLPLSSAPSLQPL